MYMLNDNAYMTMNHHHKIAQKLNLNRGHGIVFMSKYQFYDLLLFQSKGKIKNVAKFARINNITDLSIGLNKFKTKY